MFLYYPVATNAIPFIRDRKQRAKRNCIVPVVKRGVNNRAAARAIAIAENDSLPSAKQREGRVDATRFSRKSRDARTTPDEERSPTLTQPPSPPPSPRQPSGSVASRARKFSRERFSPRCLHSHKLFPRRNDEKRFCLRCKVVYLFVCLFFFVSVLQVRDRFCLRFASPLYGGLRAIQTS